MDFMTIIILILIALSVVLLTLLLILVIKSRSRKSNNLVFDSLERNIIDRITTANNEIRIKNIEDINSTLTRIINSTNENNNKLTKELNETINNRIGVIDAKVEYNLKELGESRLKLNNDTQSKLNELKESNSNSYADLSRVLINNINSRLDVIDKKVDDKLTEGFKSSNETFVKVIEQLTKIDEAQKNMEILGKDVVSLKDILANKKSRGTYGESTLYQILYSVYGDNDSICKKQYPLPYKVKDERLGTLINPIPDAVIICPDPINILCIDSKFPLENYQRTIDSRLTESEIKQATQAFKADVKNHIKVISDKYINTPTTAEIAIMFVPSESIYAEINANYSDLVTLANNKHVWLTSPTTLIAVIALIQTASRNIEMNKSTKVIKAALENLSKEFSTFTKRWDKLVGHIQNLSNDSQELNITTEKIQNQFKKIENVDIYKLTKKEDDTNEDNE
jgi:DNA recombination protein RmuC